MTKTATVTPWHDLEQQAWHAWREWPIWLALRERELAERTHKLPDKPERKDTPEGETE